MSKLGPLDFRWLIAVAPLFVFGCFTVGDDEGGDDGGGGSTGCTRDEDCRRGSFCIDRDGDRDDLCEEGETCECVAVDTGTGGSSGSSSGGSSTGGSGEGGEATGGNGTGGSSTGGTSGSSTGGTSTGGTATGGTGTGGSSGSDACGPYCGRLVDAMCAAITEAACLTDCNGFSADCPAEVAALSACVADPAKAVMCVSGQATITGCDAPIEATDRCLICVPATDDTTCDTCSKESCCETLGDYGTAADGAAFFACATACTTDACFEGCLTMYPIAGDALVALAECQDTSCPEPCICAAATDDPACLACAKTSCCSEYVDYSLAPSVAEFETCLDPCADDACIDACIAQYPMAGAAFSAMSTCLNMSCVTACAA